jgi:hypothetical protein
MDPKEASSRVTLPTQVITPAIIGLAALLQYSAILAEPAGATVPWTTYKAEAGATNGEKLTSRTFGELANEAINHTCVKISANGQYVAWKITKPANALVLRACVPDIPEGGGADYTLSLAVNGVFRQKLALSSRHSWLYGEGESGNDNAPGTGPPHACFDEIRLLLPGAALKPGDSDTAPWCAIDLVDLELAPPPATKPADFLSVTDFGAVPDDGKDDLVALNACMAKAKKESKGVWIPPGTFHQTAPLDLDHVKVRGAGSWHTHLTALGTPKPNVFAGNVGFRLAGSEIEASGVSVDGTVTRRSTDDIQHGVSGSGGRFHLEDLWISHTQTGAWLGPVSNGVITRCRFRDTYADGLNVNRHSHDVLVDQNHARGNGDDGIAVFSGREKDEAKKPGDAPCRNITVRHNTCEAQRWGNCLGAFGGEGIVVENNLAISANRCAGITISTGYGSWPAKGITIRGNTFIDCGGTAFKQRWPAIYVYVPGENLEGLIVQENNIQNSTFDGINIVGAVGKGSLAATVANNSITAPGGNGIHVQDAVHGSLAIKGNLVTGTPKSMLKLSNQSKPTLLQLRSDLK